MFDSFLQESSDEEFVPKTRQRRAVKGASEVQQSKSDMSLRSTQPSDKAIVQKIKRLGAILLAPRGPRGKLKALACSTEYLEDLEDELQLHHPEEWHQHEARRVAQQKLHEGPYPLPPSSRDLLVAQGRTAMERVSSPHRSDKQCGAEL